MVACLTRAVLVLLLVPGCLSAARRSSGAIGCPAEEVQITNESIGMFGDNTWTATCHGRRYLCSMNGTGAGQADQVTCSPAGGGGHHYEDEEPTRPAADALPTRPEAPAKAAGFSFGSTPEQAAEACSGAGGQWEPGQPEARCSKPVLPVGFEGEVRITFAGGHLNAVKVIRRAPDQQAGALKDAFVRLASALQSKYGKADQAFVRVSSLCAQNLASCLRADQAKISANWTWPSQQSISTTVDAEEKGVVLVLEYRWSGQAGTPTEGL
jgi:hypothetical protein